MTDPIHEFEQFLRTLEPRGLSKPTIESIEKQIDQSIDRFDEPDDYQVLHFHRVGWVIGTLVAAACVTLAVTIFWSTPLPMPPVADSAPSPMPGPIAELPPNRMQHSAPEQYSNIFEAKPIVLASDWTVLPTGDAVYSITGTRRIRLDQGELLVQSNRSHDGRSPAQGLVIETPEGEALAQGTRFYIGSHTGPIPQTTDSKGPQMKSMTRILVLAGVVTLSTSLGSVTGNANDLLAAEPDSPPAKVTATTNNDFALRLYHQLASEEDNEGKNLFFSPYSISNALVMTMEGARGQTMTEMGEVLGFPEAARRIGKDAQELPWETSVIHTGFSELSKRFNQKPDPEAMAAIEAKRIEWVDAAAAVEAAVEVLRSFNDARDRGTPEFKARLQEAKNARSLADHNANKIRKELDALLDTVDTNELNTVNALWGEGTYPFDTAYIERVNKFHETGGMFPVDFINNHEGARKRINQWVEDKTNNRIKELLKEGIVDPYTRLVLTNAIFFKGDWAMPFNPDFTLDRKFRRDDGKETTVPIMFSTFNTEFASDPDAGGGPVRLVSLPYQGKNLSMVLIQHVNPKSLSQLDEALTAQNLGKWLGMFKTEQEVRVTLPRFKMESDYDLKKSLIAMGMPTAFKMNPLAPADFSGMSYAGKELFIKTVVHKGFIEVNEQGTEAAAATAVIASIVSAHHIEKPEFDGTRPFVYLIRDNKTNAILFMGRMMDPAAN